MYICRTYDVSALFLTFCNWSQFVWCGRKNRLFFFEFITNGDQNAIVTCERVSLENQQLQMNRNNTRTHTHKMRDENEENKNKSSRCPALTK